MQLGFVDGILFAKGKQPEKEEPEQDDTPEEETEDDEDTDDGSDSDDESAEEKEKKPQRDAASMMYTPSHTAASFMQKISACDKFVPIAQLDKRLALLNRN